LEVVGIVWWKEKEVFIHTVGKISGSMGMHVFGGFGGFGGD